VSAVKERRREKRRQEKGRKGKETHLLLLERLTKVTAKSDHRRSQRTSRDDLRVVSAEEEEENTGSEGELPALFDERE
jgi:hypothetical protein